MKIEILRENLERAAQIAARVSNKGLSLPVLGCVVLVVSDNRAVLRATNLDVSVEVNLKAKVFSQGVAAIPAHVFLQTVSALTDQKLTLKTSGNSLVIDGERGTTAITTVDPAEFPNLPYVKDGDGTTVVIPTRDFMAALRSVAFSASTSTIKPELSSISLTIEGGELVAAATDSFRLAEVKIPVKAKSSINALLLPQRNIADIMRSMEQSETVEMRAGENQCSFVTELGFLTSRTVDGAFPDYRAIIPRDTVASAACLKEDAIRAFKKIAIFTDTFNQVHLSLKPSESKFTVRAVNASVGETVDSIPATLDGEDIDINFNARYITEALSTVGGDSISFGVAGHGKPMIMTDVPHRGFTYLVMPMNR